MRVTIDLVSIIRQANLATDGTRKCVVSGSLKQTESEPRNRDEHAEPAERSCGVADLLVVERRFHYLKRGWSPKRITNHPLRVSLLSPR